MSSSNGSTCSLSDTSGREQLIHMPRMPREAGEPSPAISSWMSRVSGPCGQPKPLTCCTTEGSAKPSTRIVSGMRWPQYSAWARDCRSRISEVSRRQAKT
eukprot:scaffold33435_cov112-Isochrysis_galbana.AAC.4